MLEAVEQLQRDYSGSDNAGKMIPLPPNTEIQELQLSILDQMILDLMKLSDNKISSLYGVPPHLVGNYEASKFNNVEQLSLNFKSNTASAIARMYRQEFEFKLLTTKERTDGASIEYNLMGLVETDHKTRIEGIKTMVNLGVLSPNDAARLEGFKTFEGGDLHFIQTNMQAIEQYINRQKNQSNE